jgi:hypothetical protein
MGSDGFWEILAGRAAGAGPGQTGEKVEEWTGHRESLEASGL